MSIDNEEPIRYHRRKSAQFWDLAGLARADGDKTDAQTCTARAREHDGYVRDILRDGACSCPQHTR